MKWVLGILLTGIIIVGVYFYIGFNGLPWKAQDTANEIQMHLENKYSIKTSIKDTYFNFKQGTYGAYFYEDGKDKTFQFHAEKTHSGIEDTYGKEVWFWQIENDLNPIVQKHMSNLNTYEATHTHGPGYTGDTNITHYKNAGQTFNYRIVLNKPWDKLDEQIIYEELLQVVKEIKTKEIKNVDIELAPTSTQHSDSKSIHIPDFAIKHIKTKEDILEYIVINTISPY
ncbi:hypothetical protein [Priestia taiwanensis]|uniref:YfjL-like N-terminal domain-containing protein n=1 Tax=Priestia taiwanensis TaxID=1347902 RepID=A0A917AM11_9BACI|nr:hypothetical protein [Priestia taiwanensis]MBM7362069.1 hypothetical protein [Priestia taiwanensis]GGE59178.1 hypothetical protein GCM10007140_06920 [Priestia taiwanensis]